MDDIRLDRVGIETELGLGDLPRARWPHPALEERTVAALKERGLIMSGSRARTGARGPWRYMVAAAAALVFFAGGVLVGQQLEASVIEGTDRVAATQSESTNGVVEVQRRTDALVLTLTSLMDAARSDPLMAADLRAAAVSGLHAVAGEVVRIAPDEPVATEIVRGFDTTFRTASADDGVAVSHVLWF